MKTTVFNVSDCWKQAFNSRFKNSWKFLTNVYKDNRAIAKKSLQNISKNEIYAKINKTITYYDHPRKSKRWKSCGLEYKITSHQSQLFDTNLCVTVDGKWANDDDLNNTNLWFGKYCLFIFVYIYIEMDDNIDLNFFGRGLLTGVPSAARSYNN